MSYPYDRADRGRRPAPASRSAFGYWLPLIVTATVATAGIAAWIWSERRDSEEYDDDSDHGRRRDGVDDSTSPGYDNNGLDPSSATARGREIRMQDDTSPGLMARMSGAIRRSPSPQQMLDGASKRVVAGVTAAGAVVGGALSSIREEDKDDYGDHSRWSEEADARSSDGDRRVAGSTRDQPSGKRASILGSSKSTASGTSQRTSGKRKTVAIVISAESNSADHDHEDSYHREEAVWRAS